MIGDWEGEKLIPLRKWLMNSGNHAEGITHRAERKNGNQWSESEIGRQLGARWLEAVMLKPRLTD
jgi:hypothetical protein